MNSTITREEDGTIVLKITIPAKEVAAQYEKSLQEVAQNAKVPGFRKGKAPAKAVEDRIDSHIVEEAVLRHLVPGSYANAIAEHKIKPIVNPQLHIEQYKKGEDLIFEATTCEAPIVDLGNYKEEVKKVTAKGKIVVPGKEEKQVNFDEIVETVLKSIKVKIPRIILEQETQRLLAQTLDEVKRLGLTLDQYLASSGKTIEDLRHDYQEKAQRDVEFEFALQKIAEEEKITVEEPEIDEAIQKAQTEQEKQSLAANRYLLAQILRQQKTLDFIRGL